MQQGLIYNHLCVQPRVLGYEPAKLPEMQVCPVHPVAQQVYQCCSFAVHACNHTLTGASKLMRVMAGHLTLVPR